MLLETRLLRVFSGADTSARPCRSLQRGISLVRLLLNAGSFVVTVSEWRVSEF